MRNTKFVKGVITSLSLYALVMMQIVFAPVSGNSQEKAKTNFSPSAIIYDNGPVATGTTARNGTAAPAGSQWSEASYNYGETAQANTLAGVGCQVIGVATSNRCADDFSVPVGQTWTINQVIYYVYQAGAVANPVVGANLRIWNGRPGDAGSTIVFGDTTTNRLASSTDAGIFRIFNSGPPNNTATGTTRRLWQVNVNVAPALALTAGTYWIDFQTDTGAAAGNFTPTTTITGTRGVPGWNARQFIGPPTNTGWADSFDDGTPVTALNVPNDFPFKLDGTVSGAPTVPRFRTLDFNGDNKSDYAIARSATVASPTDWWILNSVGASSTAQVGTGVGFAAGDKATPADFDGDGKTDIAVWRSGASPTAGFYILQSTTSTVIFDQFGQTGDDPTIVNDYDGDGKDDPAVYRPGAIGTFYHRGSLTPGNVTFTPWGTVGDTALPGDFDGDGSADFSIYRNNAGQAQHWTRTATGAISVLGYGLMTDKFVTGDFDADGRTDIGAVRANGSQYDWYVRRSSTGVIIFTIFGNPTTDYLVPADYDGDNKADFAVWRSGGAAPDFILHKTFTSPGAVRWGLSAGPNVAPDYPVGNYNVK